MPLLETAVVGGTSLVAVSAATAASAYNRWYAQHAVDDKNTLQSLLKSLDATSERIRRRSSSDEGYDFLTRKSSDEARLSPKQIPIFSYGEIAGCSVRLPSGGTCGPGGLVVTQVLAGGWAESWGAQAGSRRARSTSLSVRDRIATSSVGATARSASFSRAASGAPRSQASNATGSPSAAASAATQGAQVGA